MKIFKNRGDIYFSKTRKKTTQAKVLYICLAFIVVFTAVFVYYMSTKYSTAAEFFGEGEITVTQEVEEETKLPDISGVTNFLIVGCDDKLESIHFIFFLQADKDNKAYKVTSLSPETMINQQSIATIFKEGGVLSVKKKLVEYFGFDFDYYAQFDDSSFVEFVNKLGSFIYLSNEEINYSGGKDEDKYMIKINQGEQKISGRETANLLRYYSNQKKNYALENELVLRAVTELFNEKNFEKAEYLFKLFMKSSKTDITVRDFEIGKSALSVYCILNNEITLYSANAAYDKNNVLTQEAFTGIKGYFIK